MAQYRIPVEETFSWQRPIIDKDLNTPPANPNKGDRYIVGLSPVGGWAGKANQIAWYDGSAWRFDIPADGWVAYLLDENKIYIYKDTTWAELSEGIGDMLKSVYDTDDDGIVDAAESIDDGEGNASSAADIKDAVDKKHTHDNKTVLDDIEIALTRALKAQYDEAYEKAHEHENKAILDAIEVAFTNALKANYDEAYSRRGQWDEDLGCVIMEI